VATSVAEQVLDISEVDMVMLFEAGPSEIRAIQRRGRTGRKKRNGRMVVLVAGKTSDEACLYSEKRKERAMKDTIRDQTQH
jgi:Fanconi anemia group M protein